MNYKDYPAGNDCVWLASDRDGRLGAFVTIGSGQIPTQWLSDEGIQVEDVEGLIYQLPIVGRERLLVTFNRNDDHVAMASRGIFVYSWLDGFRTASESIWAYDAVAVPSRPIMADTLPKCLADIAKSVSFDNVTFADALPIDVRKHMDCVDGYLS